MSSSSADSARVRTFTITRDEDAGGGFLVALLHDMRPGEEHQKIVTIGSVTSGGPASRAGMTDEHVGWRIEQVNGKNVDASTCHDALDETRAPNRSFSLTAKKPRTGDITVGSVDVASNSGVAARFVDQEDIDRVQVGVRDFGDGNVQFRVSLPPHLAAMVAPNLHVLEDVLREMNLLRTELACDEAQAEALAEEEMKAAELDVDAADKPHECVCCLTKQRSVVLLPCKHFVTCHRCTVLVRRNGKCPVCRQRIEDTRLVSELAPGDPLFMP